MISRRLPLILSLLLALAAGACGSSGSQSSRSQTATGTVTIGTQSVVSQTTSASSGIGTPESSGKVDVTVSRVSSAARVTYAAGIRSALTPNGRARTDQAPQNFAYISVAATVANHGTAPLKLSCNSSLTVALADSQGNTYTPITGLDQVAANPSCSTALKPGSSSRMTWVFLTSQAGKPTAFEFAATGAAKPTVVNL